MAELHVQRKSKSLWWLWVVVILIIAAAIWYFYGYGQSDGPLASVGSLCMPQMFYV